ncbi:MAG: XrtA system polysaccharide chain length determinant [Nitrospirota bacterium]
MKTFTPQDYIDMGIRRRWWLAAPIVLCLLAAAVIGKISPKLYQSSTLIFVDPQKVPEEFVRTTVTGSMEDRLSTIKQQLLSRSLLTQIIEELKLHPRENSDATVDDVMQSMRNRITVDTVKGRNSSAFTITYVDSSPHTAMRVTNKLADLFIQENLKLREQLVEGTADFLVTEMRRLKETLVEQEQGISAYRQRYIGALPEQLDANLRTLDRLQLQLTATNNQLRNTEENQRLLDQLQSTGIDPGAPNVPGLLQQSPRLVQLQTLKDRLAQMRAEYTESYPDIVILKQELAQLEAAIMSTDASEETADVPQPLTPNHPTQQRLTLKKELATLEKQRDAILEQIALYERRVEETPRREMELASLTRDYENTRRSYDLLLSKVGDAKISENLEKQQQGEQFRIIDPANLPETPLKPNIPKLLIMGFMLGTGLGIGLVLLLENLDTSIKQASELEEMFGQPVLGIIPMATSLRAARHPQASVTPLELVASLKRRM